VADNPHKVAGIYPDETSARAAAAEFVHEDFSPAQITIIGPDDVDRLHADSDQARDAAHDVVSGAAVGAGVGALGTVALAGLQVSLVLAAPFAAALAAAGVGALTGSVVGGLFSTTMHDPDFYKITREAMSRGHWALVVATSGEREALVAQDIIGRTAVEKSVDQYGGTYGPDRETKP
jgi:hypothetical protein